ncbi:hypothetical protein ACQY0O_006939 [Thecaphora frezii]
MTPASSSRLDAVPGLSSPRSSFYPQWPDSHQEAEYYDVPPDHFLAQQRGTHKPACPASPLLALARQTSASSADSSPSAQTSDAALQIQPLAELANAIHSGVPLFPTPTPPTASQARTPLQDAIPTYAPFAEAHDEMPDTSTLAAADFDVDVRSGFLPPEPPVTRLTGRYEEHWEAALDQAKSIPLMQGGGGMRITSYQRLLARRWRRSIREMPVLSPSSDEVATDIRYARRGHLVLSFLAHFYIHSQPPAAPEAAKAAATPSWRSYFSRKTLQELRDEQDVADELSGKYSRTLPASIAVPWVQLSQKLALPPVLTYATTVLWNWAYIDPAKGLALDNIRMLESFTNTKSEEHFYLTSALIEIRGVEALELMRASLDEAFVGDILSRRRIAAYLNRLAVVIADLSRLLQDVRKECDPKVFYWGIRPWFRGSDAAEGDEQAGWHFEGVDPPGIRRSFSGPSAGQSSMIHAIDVFLDVDHTRTKPRLTRPATSPAEAANESEAIGGNSRGADATFMERMQLYMPGHHRNFLTHLRSISFDDEEEHCHGDDDIDANGQAVADGAASDVDAGGDSAAAAQGEEPAGATEARPVERPPPVFSHPIRSLALRAQRDEHDEGLPAAYDNALSALKTLRDGHMKVAYLYIIAQARGSPPDEYAPLPKGFTGVMGVEDAHKSAKGKQIESDDDILEAADSSKKGAKGTGGTDLVSFLKDCRVNTTDALIAAGKTTGQSVQTAASAINSSVPSTGAGASNGGNGCSSSSGNSEPSPASAQTSDGQSLDKRSAPSSERQDVAEDADQQTDTSSEPRLPSGGLQVWAINVASWEPEAQRFSELVDRLLPGANASQDRKKVHKYYHQIDRTRSLAARLLPRVMLQRYYGVEWHAMRFGATREGRPFLEAPALGDSATDFNISHDSDWVVMAFHAPDRERGSDITADGVAPPAGETQDRASALLGDGASAPRRVRLGVDVMKLALPKFDKDVTSFCETMDMALTPNEKTWVLSPLSSAHLSREENEEEALHRLLDLWTYKEAFTKNVGKGLGFDFQTVEVALHRLEQDRTARCTGGAWPGAVLEIKGEAEPAYVFWELQLGKGGDRSQVVVAQGPGARGRQVSPCLDQEWASECGLLTVWSMDELIEWAQGVVG